MCVVCALLLLLLRLSGAPVCATESVPQIACGAGKYVRIENKYADYGAHTSNVLSAACTHARTHQTDRTHVFAAARTRTT